MRGSTFRSIAILVIVLVVAGISPGATAGGGRCIQTPAGPVCLPETDPGTGPDPCATRGDPGSGTEGKGGGGGNSQPLCLYGPSACVAVGVIVDVAPVPTLLPFGANTQLSRSVAQAFSGAFAQGGFGFAGGQAQSRAHTARAEIPDGIGAGAIESQCYASSFAYAADQQVFYSNFTFGRADTTQFSIDLFPNYGIALKISGDVLCEEGSSYNAGPSFLFNQCTTDTPADPGPSLTGANRADIANLIINGNQIVPGGLTSTAPNTWIPLPIGDLYLNEQGVSFLPFSDCPTFWGDAFRLVLKNPSGATVASVTLSFVSTTTCGGVL